MGSIQRVDRPKPWLARYRAPDGRQHSKSFRRKIDAEKWLLVEEGSALRGDWVDPSAGSVVFGEWAETWMAGLDLKPSTRANYISNLNHRVLPYLGSIPLSAITTARVREWMVELRAKGLGPASIRQARQVVHAALEVAAADGMIPRNPVERVKAPPVRKRRQLFLSADQLEDLASTAEGIREGSGGLVRLLGYGGLRWGEAVALRWESVDLERRRISLKEAATEVGGRLTYGTPKTHESRVVIVPRFVVDSLGVPGSGLVFTAPRGGPLRHSNFTRSVWLPAVAASVVPEGLLIHDLRDTAASLAISAGASIKAVQRMLGHASAAMTLDTYGSLFEEDLETLADRMEAKYG